MFASNALIGLREGLEAALVVVILLAFLTKTGRSWANRYVWLGVGTAVALSVVLGAVLTYGTRQLTFEAQELIGGSASIIAVGFVTAMVFWMKGAARTISGELKGRLDRALDLGPLAIALVGFLGVGREGLETAIFFYATAQAAGAGNNVPLLGWLVGLVGAVVLGYLMYRGVLKINLVEVLPLDRGRARPRRRRDPLVRHPRPPGGPLPPGPDHPGVRRLGRRRPGLLVRRPAQGHPQLHPADHGPAGGRVGPLRRHRPLPLPAPRPPGPHGRGVLDRIPRTGPLHGSLTTPPGEPL